MTSTIVVQSERVAAVARQILDEHDDCELTIESETPLPGYSTLVLTVVAR